MLIKVVPSVNRLTVHDDPPMPETEKNFVYLGYTSGETLSLVYYIAVLFPF